MTFIRSLSVRSPSARCLSRRPGVTLLASLMVLCSARFASAQTPPEAPELSTEPAAEVNFALPENLQNADECFKWIEEIAATEPADDTEAAMMTHQRKLAQAVLAATGKALTLEPSDEQAMQATFFRLQALGLLTELEEPGAADLFAEAITAARTDPRPDVQSVGMKFYVEAGFSEWPAWNAEEKNALLAEIAGFIKQGKPNVSQLRTLLTVLQFLEAMQDEGFAKTMLNDLLPHFQSSDDPQILEVVKKLEGTVRRINLPGNPMELAGTLLDGSPFDWSAYRGKVVLVDFWATWCQPCRQEVPNVLKQYQAYHEKGFEVVGISLDEKREQAESYIKQYSIPWVNIFSENEAERGWDQPLAVYYGITGIPRAILVDRDGKVVSLQARGKRLGSELQRLLGEPVASADVIDDPQVGQVDAELAAE